MNLYTRARKHIDMSRVKEIREQHKEKKLLQEYNRRKTIETADLVDEDYYPDDDDYYLDDDDGYWDENDT